MDYFKLLNDYLNFTGVYDDCEVINFENRGTYIEVYYSYDSGVYKSEKDIELFDLLTFVYSKITVS